MHNTTERIETVGIGVLRYGLVFLILLWGTFKFFAFEAQGIQPLVEHSPFLGWLYPRLGVPGTSALLGLFEVTFVVTLSFLATTPGVFAQGERA
jgi:uncharacterized membrane protein YkgB